MAEQVKEQEARDNRRKIFTGIVTSDKMEKTCVVKIAWKAKHKKYHKPVAQASSFKAHDEKNEAKVGDTVRIMEVRPLSKDKRFIIREIIEKANG